MSERLTSEAAARIARAAGLGVPDAAALLQLADTEEQAEAIARQFANEQTPEQLATAVRQAQGYTR